MSKTTSKTPNETTTPAAMDSPSPVPSWRALGLVFLLAVGARGLALMELSTTDPYFSIPVVDEQTNHQQALRVATGDFKPRIPYWKPPLYPHLLAILYAPTVAGGEPVTFEVQATLCRRAKLAQILLDGITAMLVVILGARLSARAGVGIGAGIIYGLAFTPTYFAAQLLDTTLFTFACVALLVYLTGAIRVGGPTTWLIAGALGGFAAITRAPILLFLPIVAWLPLRLEKTPWTRVLGVGAVALGALLPILPVTLMNWRFTGDQVLISANGGYNFYVGNRRGDDIGSDGLTPIRVGPRDREVMALAGLEPRASRRSRLMYSATFGEIAEDPLHFGLRLLRKSHALVDGYETPNNKNFEQERSRSWVLSLLPGRTGVIFAFGIVGLIFLGGGLRHRTVLYGFLLTQAAGIVLFFVAARYRVPITAVLTIPAAALAVSIWEGTLRRRQMALITLLVLTLVLNGDPAGRKKRYQEFIIDPLALGRAQETLAERHHPGDPAFASHRTEARHYYQLALRLDPDYPEAENNLGLMDQRDAEEARTRAETLPPDDPRREELARSYRDLRESAIAHFRRSVDIAKSATATIPGFTFAEGWNNLGRTLVDDPATRDEAMRCFQRAIADDPEYATPHVNLGQLLLAARRPQEARKEFRRALALQPRNLLYGLQYARASLILGDRPEAERWVRQARAARQLSPAELQLLRQIEKKMQD